MEQILLDADQEAVTNKREGTRVVGESQVALQSTTQSETETEKAYKLLHINSWAAPVVQLVEHWPRNLVVVGSSPVQDSSSVSLSNTCLPLKCSVLFDLALIHTHTYTYTLYLLSVSVHLFSVSHVHVHVYIVHVHVHQTVQYCCTLKSSKAPFLN